MASEDDLDILAWTMLGEAAGEGSQGMADVGHVILNRLNNGKYGSSITDVAKAPKQFSTWNSGSGGNNPTGRYPKDSAEFQRARELAAQVVAGTIPGPPGRPLDYNAPSVSPYWADSKAKHGTYERNGHVFYPSVPVPKGEIPNTVGTALSTTRTPPAVPPRRPDTVASALRKPTSAADGLALNPVARPASAPMFDGEYSALNQGMMRMPAPEATWGMNLDRPPIPAMPSPQMAGLRATRPDTQLAANQAAEQMRSRANIGQPPITRMAQSVPMPAMPASLPSAPRGGSSVMDDYAYNTRPFMPQVNANAADRLVAEAGLPELYGTGGIGGVGGNAVAPIPFQRPGQFSLPTLTNPMALPTAGQLSAATGFRGQSMQRPTMPPMPFARPNQRTAPMPMPANMRPQQLARATARAPVPMPSRPVVRTPQNVQPQRPPLEILVQGSNTSQPQQQAERRAWGTPNERTYDPDTAQWR